MSSFQPELARLVERDPRYAYEAYEFVWEALSHTQRLLGRQPVEEDRTISGPENHVTGRELVEGIRDLAVREFGLMARIVFRMWGIDRTADFGEIVFNLIDQGLMTRSEDDTREEFHDVFDLNRDLLQSFRIKVDDLEWTA